jgi:hypothetical protein
MREIHFSELLEVTCFSSNITFLEYVQSSFRLQRPFGNFFSGILDCSNWHRHKIQRRRTVRSTLMAIKKARSVLH